MGWCLGCDGFSLVLIMFLVLLIAFVFMLERRAHQLIQSYQAARLEIERMPSRFETMVRPTEGGRLFRLPVRQPEQKLRLMEALLRFLWGRKQLDRVSGRDEDASSHWRLVLGDERSAIDFHLTARHNVYVTDARASSDERAKLAGQLVLELLQKWSDAYDEQVHYAASETVNKWEDVVVQRTMQCARDWLSLF